MNVCIVDDDKYVVEKIVDGIEWKKWDIEEVYVAYNMKHAKEILSMRKVDILLSDIEMPQGSGLELLEWVREQKLSIECIYLSSYAHFAYAQKALELHSRGYLLKPVSNRELESVLDNIVSQMRQAQNNSAGNIEAEKEKYWRNILLEEGRQEGSVYYENDSLILGMFRFFREKRYQISQEDALFSLTLRHMTEEIMRENGYFLDVMVRYSADCFMMVIKSDAEEREKLRKCMSQLLCNIEAELHIAACIYMGKMFRIGQIREQMYALLQMIQEGIPGDDGLIFEEEWRGVDASYEPPDFSLWEQRMIHPHAMAEVSEQIIDYVMGLWESGRANVTVFGCFKADLQQMVFHYMMENDILMNQIFEAGEFERYCDKASLTLRNMKELIRILFKKLEAVNNVENTEQGIVEQIVRYIDENLGKDLSRAKLAAIAYISEDYLSKKFASHTGMSIPNYISNRRMEKARDYFRNTNRSVSEVASLVGYTNFSYFSKTFRDYAGCTPNEYKSRYK